MHALRQYPLARLRRNRQAKFIRELTQEQRINASDLIYPVFIVAGSERCEPISALPGQSRISVDVLLYQLETAVKLGLQGLALFPVIESEKDNLASESYNPGGLLPEAVRRIKAEFPELGVFTDIALDPYTSHGQDGIIDEHGYVVNDITCETLVKQALVHAEAGADFVCPSDMMDGRIGKIRLALESRGLVNTGIMAYSAKYASQFYGPFREAVGSSSNLGKADKLSYQIHPANKLEALHEVGLDLLEGADIVMIKPGLPYLDIVQLIKQEYKLPTAVYQVSGEYAMLKAAAANGWLNYEATLFETMLCFKRAGADIIWSYAALDVLKLIQD